MLNETNTELVNMIALYFYKKSESAANNITADSCFASGPIAECHFILEAARALRGPAVIGPALYLGRLRIT